MSRSDRQSPGPSTRAVHGGEREGRPRVSDALTTPIVQTATFWFRDTQELIDYQEGRYGSFEYGRYGNPTTRALEEKLAQLEGGEECLVSASGMNSITTLLLALVPQDGHIVTTHDCYRRTRQFAATVLPKMGVRTTVIDPSDLPGLESALADGASLFFSESPTNPYLRVVDIPAVAERCRASAARVVIDSTFATPINQRALELGADIVLHSGTKYVAGHNDVLCGVLVGSGELIAPIRALHGILGGIVDPHAAYLCLRGCKTLALRVERANANAERVARFLEDHPRVERVHYPGLPSHPDHAVAAGQMSGFGGVVSFEIRGDLQRTSKFVDALRLPYIAPSLGGTESLVEQPTVISYWDQSPEERARIGIRDNLVRFSCGVEDPDDIVADLAQALERS
ncbi:MAG: aminotransferase class I/II-fold pyridoxal phosphate-dependent enzyme [Proteobacteria bacterium]|nr:aminotransferase class I/II-fold pyridoxal phosphate-dependent enzyme [Pseudomonadota bacterium]